MNSWETIRELCAICEAQNNIIKAQSDALAQVGAVVMEEEKAAVAERYALFLGNNDQSEGVDGYGMARIPAHRRRIGGIYQTRGQCHSMETRQESQKEDKAEEQAESNEKAERERIKVSRQTLSRSLRGRDTYCSTAFATLDLPISRMARFHSMTAGFCIRCTACTTMHCTATETLTNSCPRLTSCH